MADRHGICDWPALIAVTAAQYTTSHGGSPGIAIVTALSQETFPASNGTLLIYDGKTAVTIPDCRVKNITSSMDDGGKHWSLEIQDRRWRWQELGAMGGCYNQLDKNGKLIPWTIRSPIELAKLCLDAMGEVGYEIDLPPGLDSSAGAGLERELRVGENFPATGTNPPVNWDGITPVAALQQLCDLFGRRIIYRLTTNSVLIAKPGIGADLPDGSLAKDQIGLQRPATPSGVGIIGSPTRYQVRLLLEAVGLEWDGSYRPINLLSYAPKFTAGKVQINHALPTNVAVNTSFKVTFTALNANGQDQDIITFSYNPVGGDTPTIVSTQLKNQINASNSPIVKGIVTASLSGATLVLTGLQVGVAFNVGTTVSGTLPTPPSTFNLTLIQAAVGQKPNEGTWAYSSPPLFNGVRATDRLTLVDARRLAAKSVWRCYRIVAVDPATGKGQLTLPGYGVIQRRQQLILEDTQVDQIVPPPIDTKLTNRQGQPITVDFYNGYSKNKPAAVYGSARSDIVYGLWRQPNAAALAGIGNAFGFIANNTPPGTQYLVDFSVDPVNQIIVFSDYVFKFQSGTYAEPKLTLQTAVQVRNAQTGWIECFTDTQPLINGANGRTNFMLQKRPDVQLNVSSTYDGNNNLLTTSVLEVDALARARFYTAGLAAQFFDASAASRRYNGLMPIDLDGAISQVTWEVGGNGAFTTASRNSEHDIWFPSYPARRRAENLAANVQEVVQNGANPQRLGAGFMGGKVGVGGGAGT